MSFIVGGLIIGGAAAIGGAIISGKSADKATDAQVAGSQADIAFARESRELARGDQAPYVAAGHTALDALMSMTGLGGGPAASPAPSSRPPPRATASAVWNQPLNRSTNSRRSAYGRAYGGNLYGRNQGGDLYNINELGPESVFENGSFTRSSLPQTVPPSNGYVAPNIQGRVHSGPFSGFPLGWGLCDLLIVQFVLFFEPLIGKFCIGMSKPYGLARIVISYGLSKDLVGGYVKYRH